MPLICNPGSKRNGDPQHPGGRSLRWVMDAVKAEAGPSWVFAPGREPGRS